MTTTAFTPGGRADTVTDPVGLVTSYGYDLAGRQVSVTAPGSLTTNYTYNPNSEIETVTTPGGLLTTTTYDPAGRVKTVTDPAGVVTTNTWSLRGELLTTKTGAEGTVTYTYNPNGTMATAIDALGRTTTFGYDARHNLTSRTAPNGAVFSWTYNAANQMLTAVDPLNRTTTYTYDTAGRLATVTDPSGRVQTTTYNLDGSANTVAYTGGTTTTYGYDTAGRVSTLTDASGAMALGYEPGGQLAYTLSPAGRVTTWGYDAAGRRTAMGYPDGSTFQYSYDTAGRPWKITPGEQMGDTFTAANGSAPESNRWFRSVASGGTATTQANALRLLWANTAGSTASITSKAAAATDSEQLVRFQFASTSGTTVGKFVVKARNSSSGNIQVQFTSNSATATIATQVGTTGTPVSIGTLATTVTTAARWVRLKVAGTTVQVRTWADGTTEPTTWTTISNVTAVTAAGVPRLEVVRTSGTNSVSVDNYRHTDPTNAPAPVVTYGYNTDSQINSETLIGGARGRTYTLGRLTNFTETLPGLTLTTGRTYDTTGRIATETTAGVTTTYGYDAASQLTSATPSTGTARSWTYDQNGYRATETVGATTTRYQRDIAGQLCWTTTGAMPPTPTCAAPPSGATTYTSDAAGRMLTETVTATNKVTYTYDPAGRQATAQRVNGATTTTQTRTYDQLNQLTATINTGGSTTTSIYDWDPTNPATQLTAITTGTTNTSLVNGPAGWIAKRSGIAHTAVALDPYGSAIPATGTTTLARSATYTPYGAPTGTNTVEPRLGYRGELTLDNQLHLRARNYSPTLAQFTTTDPLQGVAGTTTLNNSYSYANGNPLQLVDPLGRSTSSDRDYGTQISTAAVGTAGVTAAEWAAVESSWALPAAGGSGGAGGVAATTVLLPAAIVVASAWTGYEIYQAGSAIENYFDQRAEWTEINANLDLTNSLVQQKVNDGIIPEGRYGGHQFRDETPEPQTDGAGSRSGGRNGRSCSQNARTLGSNLRGVGISQPPGTEAHHIVASNADDAIVARMILIENGIDINSPYNGVFLPGNSNSPNPDESCVHRSVHTDRYYSDVNNALRGAKSREAVVVAPECHSGSAAIRTLRVRTLKVYTASPSGGGEWVLPVIDADIARFDGFGHGIPLSGSWESVEMRLIQTDKERERTPVDMPWFVSNTLILKPLAAEKIRTILELWGELLPLHCDGLLLLAYNALNVIDAIDEEHSELLRDSDGSVFLVNHLELRPEIVDGNDVFHVPQLPYQSPFFSHRFVEQFIATGLSGVSFEQVWQFDTTNRE